MDIGCETKNGPLKEEKGRWGEKYDAWVMKIESSERYSGISDQKEKTETNYVWKCHDVMLYFAFEFCKCPKDIIKE